MNVLALQRLAAIVVVCVAIFMTGTIVDAAILVEETFSHLDGNLVGQSPTPGPGSDWTAHLDMGNTPVEVNDATAVLHQGKGSGGREDVNIEFPRQSATGTTYARFDFLLPAVSNADVSNLDLEGSNFAHLKSNNLTNHFRARTGVLAPSSSGDFALAINANGSRLSDGTRWPTELSFATWYRVLVSWNATTGESLLWVDPVDESSPNISNVGHSSGQRIESFALRQSSDYAGIQWIDNLVVATTFADALSGSASAVGLPGDFNGDNRVDALDYTVWRNNFGDVDETEINNNGDGGDIGQSDFNLWKLHYGELGDSGDGGLATVPEPSTVCMDGLISIAVIAIRRRTN